MTHPSLHWQVQHSMSDPAANTFVVRPAFREKFPTHKVREIIRAALDANLRGEDGEPLVYDSSVGGLTQKWGRTIADEVRTNVTGIEAMSKRYKVMVQCIIGENKAEGVRMGTRCLWDHETDAYASESFIAVRWCAACARQRQAAAAAAAARAPATRASALRAYCAAEARSRALSLALSLACACSARAALRCRQCLTTARYFSSPLLSLPPHLLHRTRYSASSLSLACTRRSRGFE